MNEMVILVDEHDTEIGVEEKLAAHQKGLLHRAFSVFIFNAKGELLLQRRAAGKYHSAGLWSNTCCSHPAPGEETIDAAHRRLEEEMGFDCELKSAGHLLYQVHFENGLSEHEFDYVFIGKYNGPIAPDQNEVSESKWISPEELLAEIQSSPAAYTYWLSLSLKDVLKSR